jgi:hypothetical protein
MWRYYQSVEFDVQRIFSHLPRSTMSSNETETAVVPKPPKTKKMKPARKQVKPGDVEKKETPQTGKEYSSYSP